MIKPHLPASQPFISSSTCLFQGSRDCFPALWCPVGAPLTCKGPQRANEQQTRGGEGGVPPGYSYTRNYHTKQPQLAFLTPKTPLSPLLPTPHPIQPPPYVPKLPISHQEKVGGERGRQ